jgi:thioredoxin 2
MSSMSVNCPSCKATNRISVMSIDQSPTCSKCSKALLDGVVVELLPHNFQPLSGSQTPLIVFMSGPNCSICKSFSDIFSASAKQHANKVRFSQAYLPNNKALVSKYKIRGVPTIALFRRGKLQGMVNGGMKKNELAQFIKNTLG